MGRREAAAEAVLRCAPGLGSARWRVRRRDEVSLVLGEDGKRMAGGFGLCRSICPTG